MTEDLIAMAESVGAAFDQILYGRTDYVVMTDFEFERFAALIEARAVERTREECAKVCDDMVLYTGFDCAQAIRALGERT